MTKRAAFFRKFPDGWMVVITEDLGTSDTAGEHQVIDASMFPMEKDARAFASRMLGPSEVIYWGPN